MNRRLVRAMLATLALAGLLAVGAPAALAQSCSDLAVTLEADRTTAKAGQSVTYTITVSNLGDTTATDVSLFLGCSDNLQCGLFNSTLGDLEPGASVTVTMVATANPCGLSISRDATVVADVSSTSPEANPSNNSDRVTIRLQRCHQR
jgi:subtilase family serine protease